MGNRGNAQAGFTLIEVAIVAAVIGILASILMPQVRTYSARTKVSEAILALTHCRNHIHELYLAGADIPGADNWGCEVERPSRFVERIRTSDEGVIRLTLGNEIGDLRLAIHDITMAPLNGTGALMREDDLGTPVRRWRCGATVDGTDVKAEFLPSSCRG
ncbi:MAG TPA: pilin [Burkholderiales bacterium]|nr:pilin [Burkholderiales bacterium]